MQTDCLNPTWYRSRIWEFGTNMAAFRRTEPAVSNDYFSLSANGGVPRDRVIEILRNPKLVAQAIKRGRCFQCQAIDIDPTGLCLICRTFLSDEEREVAQSYY